MKILAAVVVVTLAIGGALAAFVHSGAYPVGADEPHWPATAALIASTRDRALAKAAREVTVPANLDDAARLRRGAGNYEAMCAGCHLRPGVDDSEIRKGLYPQPPNLAASDADRDPARQFWVIKHGLKMTGMPAWGLGGMHDTDIWDLVALLQKLPQLSPRDYAELVGSSRGHTHAGMEPAHDDPPGAPPHEHAPSSKPHAH
jgi:mono/diheme cytochrome c family protein